MHEPHTEEMRERTREREDDRSWYPVYASVLVFAVIVIGALWAFSRYFSS